MGIKRRLKKHYLVYFLIILLLFYYGPSYLGGYVWTENAAIRHSYPFQNGKVVFEADFSGHSIVIVDTGIGKYAKLIEHPLNLVYRTISSDDISGETADKKMRINWSARRKDNHLYDALFAVYTLNDEIVKVVVSNDKQRNNNLTLSAIKDKSTFYVEMAVKNGYAAYYCRLSQSKLGGFIFRGINSHGEIVSVY